MTTTHTNNQARKSLATQIDRLDGILDGLADGLNEAVAMAVKDAVTLAVRETVQAVLVEVLTNPDLQQRLRPSTPAPKAVKTAQPGRPLANVLKGCWGWLTRTTKTACSVAVGAVSFAACKIASITRRATITVVGKVQTAAQTVKQVVVTGWMLTLAMSCLALRLRRPLLMALGFGLVTAVFAYLAGPVVAAVLSGLNSVLLSLIVSAFGAFGSFARSAPADAT